MRPTAIAIPGPLTEARFDARPNRFVVHARLPDGSRAVAHLADPGRLKELLVPGRRLWLRPASDPHRKTRWSAVLVETPDGSGLVSLDTTLPNRLVLKALERGALEELSDWHLERPEFTVGGSRFDFLLRHSSPASHRRTPRRLLLEVKSVTLVENRVGLFPDAVTARGARHVLELSRLVRGGGWACAILFVVQRQDVDRVLAAAAIDPHFAAALNEARAAGVRVLARHCAVAVGEVVLGRSLPVGT